MTTPSKSTPAKTTAAKTTASKTSEPKPSSVVSDSLDPADGPKATASAQKRAAETDMEPSLEEIDEKSAEVAADSYDASNEVETEEPEEEEEPELTKEEQDALDHANEVSSDTFDDANELHPVDESEVDEPEEEDLTEEEQKAKEHSVEVSEDAFEASNETTEHLTRAAEKAQEREDAFQEARFRFEDDVAMDHGAIARAEAERNQTDDNGRLGLGILIERAEPKEPIGGSYRPEDSIWKRWRNPADVAKEAGEQMLAEKKKADEDKSETKAAASKSSTSRTAED